MQLTAVELLVLTLYAIQSRIPISKFESETLKTTPSPSKNPKFPLETPPPMFLRAMPIPPGVVKCFI